MLEHHVSSCCESQQSHLCYGKVGPGAKLDQEGRTHRPLQDVQRAKRVCGGERRAASTAKTQKHSSCCITPLAWHAVSQLRGSSVVSKLWPYCRRVQPPAQGPPLHCAAQRLLRVGQGEQQLSRPCAPCAVCSTALSSAAAWRWVLAMLPRKFMQAIQLLLNAVMPVYVQAPSARFQQSGDQHLALLAPHKPHWQRVVVHCYYRIWSCPTPSASA